MRKATIAGFGAGVALLLAAAGPAGALPAECDEDSGGVGASTSSRRCADPGYVNPFKPKRWDASRIDMGVDYLPHKREPLVASGDAKVLGSDRHSGWPGGAFLYYKLLDGDHRGDIIFVAEHIRKLVRKGRVKVGEQLGVATPGSTGIEIGWATSDGQPRAYPCYSEGEKTNAGKQMARFLHSLGAKLGDRPGKGPDHPTGKRC